MKKIVVYNTLFLILTGCWAGNGASSLYKDTNITSVLTQVSSNIKARNLNIVSGNSINIKASNVTTTEDLNITAKEFNVTSAKNRNESVLIHEENTPNYLGYAARGAIDGAVAGWLAKETGGKNSDGSAETRGDVYASNVGLGGVNDFLRGVGFNATFNLGKIIGVASTPINKLTGFGSTALVDSTIGLENIDISTSRSILITNVDSNINVGGSKVVNLVP